MQPSGRLTTPPQDEVELVTNSARQLLPEANTIKSRARSATLDKFFLSRFPGRIEHVSRRKCLQRRPFVELSEFAASLRSAYLVRSGEVCPSELRFAGL